MRTPALTRQDIAQRASYVKEERRRRRRRAGERGGDGGVFGLELPIVWQIGFSNMHF